MFDVTVRLKFDTLREDKLTFPSHTGILRSWTIRTGKGLSLYFWLALPLLSQGSAQLHVTALGAYLGGLRGQNLPGRRVATLINFSQT